MEHVDLKEIKVRNYVYIRPAVIVNHIACIFCDVGRSKIIY